MRGSESMNSEPRIKVAIILPEDKLQKINIRFPDPEQYSLKFNGRLSSKNLPETLEIKNLQNKLIIKGNNSDSIQNISIIPRSKRNTTFLVQEIPAGRGFHWQKKIQVELPGSAHFQIKDGFLLMVNELPLEDYLKCVATSEMSSSCPAALLETQTIVARSWILANAENKHSEYNVNVCNDDCCQRYQGLNNISPGEFIRKASTRGKVLMFGNRICDTRYSKSCGGKTESSNNVWGTPEPYMISLPDYPERTETGDLTSESIFIDWLLNPDPQAFCGPQTVKQNKLIKYLGSVDKKGTYFRWEVSCTNIELEKIIRHKLNLNISKLINITALKRGESGRIIKLEIKYEDKNCKLQTAILNSEYEIRRCLHISFLYSSAFAIIKNDDGFILKGAGWGHGAGLCQIGALGMALEKYGTEEILKHYFPGTELKQIYK